MSKEKIPLDRIEEQVKMDPSQLWYCEKCKHIHTPDWNCTHSIVVRV